ncbi:probable cytochrome P450 6a14 [Chironomus tepperi]|uniref:probable cytochrome P450 6a14 n=1 Tax=Chironomus tepperi TaxID=113505 RepID=UPI00391EE574
MDLAITLVLLLLILVFLINLIHKRYSALKVLGFLHEKPEFPFGNLKGIGIKHHMIHILERTYKKFSKISPIHGLYAFFNTTFVVTDLDIVKDVLANNFDIFHNRGLFNSKEFDPLSAHLAALEDYEWRKMRTILTPTYTSGKMKMMFNTVLSVSDRMIEKLRANENLQTVEVREVIASFMTDVIGNIAFGLEMHAIDDPNSEFRRMGRKVFGSANFLGKILLLSNFRNLARKLRLQLFPMDVSNFFRHLVRETVEYRRANNIERDDMLNLLMKIGSEGNKSDEKLTMDEITAQCFLFFVGGFETSSSTSTFTLFNLAGHLDVQDKVRGEIQSVLAKHDNKITYEAMKEMKYLDMVLNETLRMYPPGAIAIREASRDFKVPNTDLIIPKSSMVFIPIYSIQRDPDIYPDPEKFDPERFTEENVAKRHPMAHIPFCYGPRNCIGYRYGLMQIKIALIQLLINFEFTRSPQTPKEIVYNLKNPVLSPATDIILKIRKLSS